AEARRSDGARLRVVRDVVLGRHVQAARRGLAGFAEEAAELVRLLTLVQTVSSVGAFETEPVERTPAGRTRTDDALATQREVVVRQVVERIGAAVEASRQEREKVHHVR